MEKEIIEKIRSLYLDEKKSIRTIEKETRISYYNVRKILKENGIKARDKNEINNTGRFKKGQEPHNKIKISDEDKQKIKELFNNYVPIRQIAKTVLKTEDGQKAVERVIKELGLSRDNGKMMARDFYDDTNDEEIIKLYEEGMSSTEIAKILNTTHGSILKHLTHCGIKIRTMSEAQFAYNKKEMPEDLKNYDTLYDLYITQKKSKKDLGLLYNVSEDCIDRILREFDIPVRGNSEARKGLFVGPNHPNWKGGRSGLYMRLREFFHKEQVPIILKRDGYVCQCEDCNSKKDLQVHHIIPFKQIFDELLEENNVTDDTLKEREEELYEIFKTDERFLNLDNLITYCKRCHLFKIHGYKETGEYQKTKERKKKK